MTNTDTEHKNLTRKITDFLESIGINIVEETLLNNTFLPGIMVKENSIFIDTNKLKYPGDLLHEAGHLAVSEAHLRSLIGTSEIDADWPKDGEEIAAILWSYAACHYLNLDLRIVFHTDGYKNESEWLIEQFSNKNYIGLPLLEWMGLCTSDEFPKMKKWLR